MATDATATLVADGDATEWLSSPDGQLTLFNVVVAPHADFTGDLLFERLDLSDPLADFEFIETVTVEGVVAGVVPAQSYLALVPAGWGFRVALSDGTTIAESVAVNISRITGHARPGITFSTSAFADAVTALGTGGA